MMRLEDLRVWNKKPKVYHPQGGTPKQRFPPEPKRRDGDRETGSLGPSARSDLEQREPPGSAPSTRRWDPEHPTGGGASPGKTLTHFQASGPIPRAPRAPTTPTAPAAPPSRAHNRHSSKSPLLVPRVPGPYLRPSAGEGGDFIPAKPSSSHRTRQGPRPYFLQRPGDQARLAWLGGTGHAPGRAWANPLWPDQRPRPCHEMRRAELRAHLVRFWLWGWGWALGASPLQSEALDLSLGPTSLPVPCSWVTDRAEVLPRGLQVSHTQGLRGYWSGPLLVSPAPGRAGPVFVPLDSTGPNWPAAYFPPTPARPVGPPHPPGLRPKIESDPVPPVVSGKEMP